MTGRQAILICFGFLVVVFVIGALAALGYDENTPVGPDGIHPARHLGRGLGKMLGICWIGTGLVYYFTRKQKVETTGRE